MSEYDAKYIIKPIFETTPITEELLKMPPAGDSTISKEYLKTGNNQISVNCPNCGVLMVDEDD